LESALNVLWAHPIAVVENSDPDTPVLTMRVDAYVDSRGMCLQGVVDQFSDGSSGTSVTSFSRGKDEGVGGNNGVRCWFFGRLFE